MTCLCLSKDKYSIKINTEMQKFLVPFPLLIELLSEFKTMKHLLVFQTSFSFSPWKILTPVLPSSPYIYWFHFASGTLYFREPVMWDSHWDFLCLCLIYFYQVSWKDLRGCCSGSAYSLFSFIKELRPPGEGQSMQIVQSWFFILETHTYFFLIEADDNVKIQLKSFSEWRHLPRSELLHPAHWKKK